MLTSLAMHNRLTNTYRPQMANGGSNSLRDASNGRFYGKIHYCLVTKSGPVTLAFIRKAECIDCEWYTDEAGITYNALRLLKPIRHDVMEERIREYNTACHNPGHLIRLHPDAQSHYSGLISFTKQPNDSNMTHPLMVRIRGMRGENGYGCWPCDERRRDPLCPDQADPPPRGDGGMGNWEGVPRSQRRRKPTDRHSPPVEEPRRRRRRGEAGTTVPPHPTLGRSQVQRDAAMRARRFLDMDRDDDVFGQMVEEGRRLENGALDYLDAGVAQGRGGGKTDTEEEEEEGGGQEEGTGGEGGLGLGDIPWEEMDTESYDTEDDDFTVEEEEEEEDDDDDEEFVVAGQPRRRRTNAGRRSAARASNRGMGRKRARGGDRASKAGASEASKGHGNATGAARMTSSSGNGVVAAPPAPTHPRLDLLSAAQGLMVMGRGAQGEPKGAVADDGQGVAMMMVVGPAAGDGAPSAPVLLAPPPPADQAAIPPPPPPPPPAVAAAAGPADAAPRPPPVAPAPGAAMQQFDLVPPQTMESLIKHNAVLAKQLFEAQQQTIRVLGEFNTFMRNYIHQPPPPRPDDGAGAV